MRRSAVALGTSALAAACLAGYLGAAAYAATPLSRSAYERQMMAIGKGFAADENALSEAATTAHKAQLALTKLQRQLGGIDSSFAAITPPTPIKADQARLVAGIAEFARELGPVIAKLKGGDLNALSSLNTLAGFKEFESAVAAINAAGYKIG